MCKIKGIIIIPLICMILTLTGCGGSVLTVPTKFDKNFKTEQYKSFTAAENEQYLLKWDGDNKRVVLQDKISGQAWSNVPSQAMSPRYDEDGDVVSNNAQLEASITVEYIDPETQNLKNINGYIAALKKGNYNIEKISNGFVLTYFFEKEEISVPVTYTLGDDYISISVDPTKVTENENKIYSVSVAPFFCGIANGENGYLFIPSGSGAIIYADDILETSRSYSTPVYGQDYQIYPEGQLSPSVKESVYLPVFGSVSKNGEGVCGIITSGEGAASIELNHGNSKIGYSTVYPKFALRGYQNATALITTWKYESRIYSDELASYKMSVRYYPLKNENASLVGMADTYRGYLSEKYDMTSHNDDKLLNIKIYGGAMVEKSLFGVPYSTIFPTTTTAEAQKIIEDIINETGITPNVNLFGFTESGTDVGELAGGYSASEKLGGNDGISKLSKWCSENSVPLYFDFDLVSFSKSGNGFSTVFDTAIATNKRTTNQKTYNIGTKSVDLAGKSYFLLKRSLIEKSADKALKVSESMSLNGVALNSISNCAYSDYVDQKYFNKGNMAEDVTAIINKFTSVGKNVMVNSPNEYAAANATVIYDTPTISSKESIFDADVPFYQIVFKGYKPMSSASINLIPDADDSILQCIETGLGLQYTLSNNYSVLLKENKTGNFYASVYKDIKEYLINSVSGYQECFDLVKNAKITNYEILSNKVRKTTFDNGVMIYVNYDDKDFTVADGLVNANGYLLVKEGEQQ